MFVGQDYPSGQLIRHPGYWQLSVGTDGVGSAEDPEWHGGLHTIIGSFFASWCGWNLVFEWPKWSAGLVTTVWQSSVGKVRWIIGGPGFQFWPAVVFRLELQYPLAVQKFPTHSTDCSSLTTSNKCLGR